MVHPSKTKHEIGKSKRNLLDQAKMTLLLKNDYLRKFYFLILTVSAISYHIIHVL